MPRTAASAPGTPSRSFAFRMASTVDAIRFGRIERLAQRSARDAAKPMRSDVGPSATADKSLAGM
ncbi:hypothetical protein [Sphingopyxis sp. EG6]|uniref:hypothetical protein n=1 Tax=Sphingopyxis sp. EG6 TaxID=1874061 RepID=UPI001559B2CC|nr:hypothetical protein [Sphingopyxis sp. EG6]